MSRHQSGRRRAPAHPRMDHMIHHRAQLGVYLRLLDVPVPQSFGPTADFPDM